MCCYSQTYKIRTGNRIEDDIGLFRSLFLFIILMGLDDLPACMSLHCVHAYCLKRPGEVIRYLETLVIDNCEISFDCWE